MKVAATLMPLILSCISFLGIQLKFLRLKFCLGFLDHDLGRASKASVVRPPELHPAVADVGQFHDFQGCVPRMIDVLSKPSLPKLRPCELIIKGVTSKVGAANELELVVI